MKNIIIGSIQKFISIVDNELQLINDIPIGNKPIKIISFIGNARTGKSTLMNCYISNKLNENIKKFNTANRLDNHCTTGIDMLLVETPLYNLILLDVQGLELQDSRDDCKLMLFVYLISNLIIFCPKTILDNTVLSSLQSLTTILTFVDNIENNTNKPSLIFRPRDINEDADFNPNKNLSNMLTDTKDQFEHVRSSIKQLFNQIDSLPTFSLDKSELKLLSNNKFIEFMANQSNGFEALSNNIDIQIENIKYHDMQSIDNIIKDINRNKKIDYKIFDTTKREAELDIKEWILDTIDKSNYDTPIESDGTQTNYEQFIQQRINYKEKILAEFDKRFEKTTPKIKEQYRKEISDKFLIHIDIAEQNAIKIAEAELQIIFDKHIKTYKKDNIYIDLIKDIDIDLIINEIYNYINNNVWLNIIKGKYNVLISAILHKLKNDINNLSIQIQSEYDKYITSQIENIKNFLEVNKPIDDIYINDICLSFDMINEKINNKYQEDIITKLEYIRTSIIIKYDNTKDEFIINQYVSKNKSNNKLNHKEILDSIKKSGILDEDIQYYLGKTYEEIFIKKREENLSGILNNMQSTNTDITDYSYLNIKKLYIDNKNLCNKIIDANNNVKFLDIFDNLIIKLEQNKIEQIYILSKYAFIVNKLNIHQIYTIDDFNIKYDFIKKYLIQLDKTTDIYLKYNITIKIMDVLFDKALELF